MLEEMIHELDRLITKYDGPDWNTKPTANRVVALLTEHRALIQIELNEVNTGVRKLTDRDFLGPKERERRRRLKVEDDAKSGVAASAPVQQEDKKDYSEYFRELEIKIHKQKLRERRQLAETHRHAQRGA